MKPPIKIVQEALDAANKAGDFWMAAAAPKYVVSDSYGRSLGTMLDLCGNAHLQFKDKRSKNYKDFLKADLVRKSGNGVVELHHNYNHRQEYGLHMACVEAAKKVFEDNCITDVRIWSYID